MGKCINDHIFTPLLIKAIILKSAIYLGTNNNTIIRFVSKMGTIVSRPIHTEPSINPILIRRSKCFSSPPTLYHRNL